MVCILAAGILAVGLAVCILAVGILDILTAGLLDAADGRDAMVHRVRNQTITLPGTA